MSWWPYGEEAVRLAEMVLRGEIEEAQRIAMEIMLEEQRMERFRDLEQEFCKLVDNCQWVDAETKLVEMSKVGIWDTSEITRYQTMLSFERDTTVLDRIVREVDDDDA